jgi:peptidoglycan/LPS O-acetylase OafA/YrhL
MRYLGKISYGFYVFHIAALVIAGKAVGLVGAPAWIAFPAGLALTIASAALSYAVYEKPFLRLKERFEQVKARPV